MLVGSASNFGNLAAKMQAKLFPQQMNAGRTLLKNSRWKKKHKGTIAAEGVALMLRAASQGAGERIGWN